MINEIQLIKSNEDGAIYDCGKVKLIIKKEGSVSADHSHQEAESLFLIDGNAEITLDKDIKKVSSPISIDIPSNIYHKILALTNIKLIEDKI